MKPLKVKLLAREQKATETTEAESHHSFSAQALRRSAEEDYAEHRAESGTRGGLWIRSARTAAGGQLSHNQNLGR